MDIVKILSLLSIAFLVKGSSGENLHHKCIHDRIAVSGGLYMSIHMMQCLLNHKYVAIRSTPYERAAKLTGTQRIMILVRTACRLQLPKSG